MLQTFFIVIGASASLLLMFWILAITLQYFYPDTPIPRGRDADLKRRLRMKAGGSTNVHFEDIRTLERDRVLSDGSDEPYRYDEGMSTGWPESWWDDLDSRKN